MLEDLFRFFLLGLGPGAIYGLVAIGIVLVYRGSGVVNFAGGGFALAGASVFMELRDTALGTWGAFAAAVVVGAFLGAATQLFLMHPLRRAAALTRVVATLGVLVSIQHAAELRYGVDSIFVRPFLPLGGITIMGAVITADRLIIVGITVLLTGLLWAAYRYTKFGIATSAVAENSLSAAAAGWSPNVIAAVNWALGGGLAGGAGVLLAPLLGFAPTVFALTVVPALAASLIAGFRSFPLALAGGVLLGVLESESTYLQTRYNDGLFGFIPTTGLSSSVPFVVIILLTIVRGRALPLRSELTDRLPALGSGVPNWRVLAPVVAALVGSIWLLSDSWVAALTTSASVALVALSVVVVTGYAGQLSLVQFALAGLGAFFSSRLADAAGWPFPLAVLAGVVLTVLFGVLVALPAVRVRGVSLAVVTLGLSVVVSASILANPDWNGGGIRGTRVSPPTLFGFEVDSVNHAERWALLCLVLLSAAGLTLTNVRRGRAGRRLIAVRDNERAATSLGVDVAGSKLYAFGYGAALAGLGGALLAFRNVNVTFDQYTVFESIEIILLTVIGGLGFVIGGLVAGAAVLAGVVHHVLNQFWEIAGTFELVLSLLFLVAIVVHQDGFAALTQRLRRGRKGAGAGNPTASSDAGGSDNRDREGPDAGARNYPVLPKVLEVRHLTVRFGGLVAVDDLSLTVAPGEVVGLIGPNGAGKTTVIDAISGFVTSSGEIRLAGGRLEKARAVHRARAGLTRSFQSLELFEDLTVADNLLIASDDGGWRHFFLDPFALRQQQLSPAACAAVAEFGLGDVLDRKPGELPYARRRLVAIARAVAASPSIVMLDEPAAGLDTTSRLELERLVRRLAREWGIGVLLVEHDVGMVMRTCDRVIALYYGKQLTEGPPEEVRHDRRLIDAYIGQHIEAPNDSAVDDMTIQR